MTGILPQRSPSLHRLDMKYDEIRSVLHTTPIYTRKVRHVILSGPEMKAILVPNLDVDMDMFCEVLFAFITRSKI